RPNVSVGGFLKLPASTTLSSGACRQVWPGSSAVCAPRSPPRPARLPALILHGSADRLPAGHATYSAQAGEPHRHTIQDRGPTTTMCPFTHNTRLPKQPLLGLALLALLLGAAAGGAPRRAAASTSSPLIRSVDAISSSQLTDCNGL